VFSSSCSEVFEWFGWRWGGGGGGEVNMRELMVFKECSKT